MLFNLANTNEYECIADKYLIIIFIRSEKYTKFILSQ